VRSLESVLAEVRDQVDLTRDWGRYTDFLKWCAAVLSEGEDVPLAEAVAAVEGAAAKQLPDPDADVTADAERLAVVATPATSIRSINSFRGPSR
jgi:hypothetical protein